MQQEFLCLFRLRHFAMSLAGGVVEEAGHHRQLRHICFPGADAAQLPITHFNM
jgi:hypothetical protein